MTATAKASTAKRLDDDSEFQTVTREYYADQIVQVGIGPHVSKLTFAMENGVDNKSLQNAFAVIMPTSTLLNLADNIANIVSEKEMLIRLRDEAKTFLSDLESRLSKSK